MAKIEAKNLITGLQEEMDRVRELIVVYESIGRAGVFGVAFMKLTIKKAEMAIATGDIVAMIKSLKELKDHEE